MVWMDDLARKVNLEEMDHLVLRVSEDHRVHQEEDVDDRALLVHQVPVDFQDQLVQRARMASQDVLVREVHKAQRVAQVFPAAQVQRDSLERKVPKESRVLQVFLEMMDHVVLLVLQVPQDLVVSLERKACL